MATVHLFNLSMLNGNSMSFFKFSGLPGGEEGINLDVEVESEFTEIIGHSRFDFVFFCKKITS